MEMIEALHQLELTYRLGIFAVLMVVGLLYTRDWTSDIMDKLPATLGSWVDTVLGVVMFMSFIVAAIALVRFGVQIIIGV